MKKRIVTCAVGIAAMGLSTIASGAEYHDAINAVGGAVHHWGFEEASGDAIDTVGSADMTAVNSPTRVIDPLLNNKFKGLGGAGNQSSAHENADNDYWTAGDAVLIIGEDNVSMSYFLYQDPTDTGTHQYQLGLQRDPGSGRYLFSIRADDPGSSSYTDFELLAIVRWDENEVTDHDTETPRVDVSPADGEWHHVVMAYDAINDELGLYVDGSLQTSISDFNGDAVADAWVGDAGTNLSFNVGSDPTLPDRAFNGGIDEVTLFNQTLSAQDVEDLYLAALVPEPASLALLGLGSLMMIRRRKA